jgi:hypothetical protein
MKKRPSSSPKPAVTAVFLKPAPQTISPVQDPKPIVIEEIKPLAQQKTNTKVAETIDEFHCKRCFEIIQQPTLAPCLHSVCSSSTCKNKTTKTCGICDVKKCPVSHTLPTNYVLQEQMQMYSQTSTPKCSKQSCRQNAFIFCNDCNKIYCKQCKIMHDSLFEDHSSTMPIEQYLNSSIHQSSTVMCSTSAKHGKASLFCVSCQHMLCVSCIYTKHNGHQIVAIEDASKMMNNKLLFYLAHCKKRVEELNQYRARFFDCLSQAEKDRDSIIKEGNQYFDRLQAMIYNQRKVWQEQVIELHQQQKKSILNELDVVTQMIQSIQLAEQYTQAIEHLSLEKQLEMVPAVEASLKYHSSTNYVAPSDFEKHLKAHFNNSLLKVPLFDMALVISPHHYDQIVPGEEFTRNNCLIHPSQPLQFVCQNDNTLICSLCVSTNHLNHSMQPISEKFVDKELHLIQSNLNQQEKTLKIDLKSYFSSLVSQSTQNYLVFSEYQEQIISTMNEVFSKIRRTWMDDNVQARTILFSNYDQAHQQLVAIQSLQLFIGNISKKKNILEKASALEQVKKRMKSFPVKNANVRLISNLDIQNTLNIQSLIQSIKNLGFGNRYTREKPRLLKVYEEDEEEYEEPPEEYDDDEEIYTIKAKRYNK